MKTLDKIKCLQTLKKTLKKSLIHQIPMNKSVFPTQIKFTIPTQTRRWTHCINTIQVRKSIRPSPTSRHVPHCPRGPRCGRYSASTRPKAGTTTHWSNPWSTNTQCCRSKTKWTASSPGGRSRSPRRTRGRCRSRRSSTPRLKWCGMKGRLCGLWLPPRPECRIWSRLTPSSTAIKPWMS